MQAQHFHSMVPPGDASASAVHGGKCMNTSRFQGLAARLLLALAPIFAAGIANGAEPEWRSIGPAPPAVEAAVLSDPGSGTMLIGGTGGGILRSTDGGHSF